MTDDHPIKQLATRITYQNPWYRVRQDDVQLPDGTTGEYNVIEARDSVWAVPITPQGELVMIQNFRYTLGQWVWELPAGGIEGDVTRELAVKNELLEEIGGISDEFQFLISASTMNGIGATYAHYFIAWDVRLTPPRPEVMEFIKIRTIPFFEAIEFARAGKMNDALSMTALFLAEPHFRARFPNL